MWRTYLLFIWLFLLLQPVSFAQDSSLLLSNVVITASQTQQQQRESGRNILTVKGAAFSALPVHSVDDLLRFIPGIEIQQRGPQGAQADITIRGGTFQQVLVIIDGVKLNDPLTGHFSLYVPVHPSEIDRVEILKGAASAVWGAEAVGGVVHIITKTFADKQQAVTSARIQTGEAGLFNGDIYISRKINKGSFSAGLFSNNASGPALRGTRGFFHLHTVSLALSRHFSHNWRLSLRLAADRRSFNAQNFYTSFISDTANEKINTGWLHAAAVKKYHRSQLTIDLAVKKLRDQYWFRPAAVPNDNNSSLLLAQLYYSGMTGKKSGYTTGVQFTRKAIRSNDRGNHRIWHAGMYGIFRQQPLKGFFITESIRLDRDEKYGWVLIPQLNLAHTSGRVTVRASGGKSFRDADFTERYNNYNKAQVASGRIGNPDLSPEKSWNAELGTDIQLASGLKLSSTLFLRDHTAMIDWVNTAYNAMPRKENLVPGGTYALASNVEYIQTRGLETDLVFQRQGKNGQQLLAMAGFTWIRSENEDPVPSLYISSHARFLSNLSFSWTGKKIQVAAAATGKKRGVQQSSALNTALSPAVFVLNSRIAWLFAEKRGRIFLQADNLFDTRYSDLLGAIMPGRWLSGGIQIAL